MRSEEKGEELWILVERMGIKEHEMILSMHLTDKDSYPESLKSKEW